MSYGVYKVLHLLGVMLLFASLGGLTLHALNGGDRASNRHRALVGAAHGVALLLLLVAGFGALAKLDTSKGVPPWVWGKLTVWLLLGATPAVLARRPALARVVFFAAPLLGVGAALLAVTKPGG